MGLEAGDKLFCNLKYKIIIIYCLNGYYDQYLRVDAWANVVLFLSLLEVVMQIRIGTRKWWAVRDGVLFHSKVWENFSAKIRSDGIRSKMNVFRRKLGS